MHLWLMVSWRYNGRNPLTDRETVVSGMPGGGHGTRTLEFGDNDTLMYINIGSAGNLDTDSSRSKIIRVNLTSTFPIAYSSATNFAIGTRNTVGMRIDPQNRLWTVENSIDNLPRFSACCHNANPAEKVNIMTQANIGKDYGYPDCFAEGLDEGYDRLPGAMGPGTVWATYDNKPKNDSWCRANTIGPAWAMQAHTAPLDINFDTSGLIVPSPGVAAVIALHGSWNRNPDAGVRVDYLTLDKDYNIQSLKHLVEFPRNPRVFRPVSVVRTSCKSHGTCLFVTNDFDNWVYAIGKISSPNAPTTAPVAVPPPHSANVIQVNSDTTLTWSISPNGKDLITNITHNNAHGWFGFAWVPNRSMSGTAVMCLDGTFGGVGQDASTNSSQYLGFVDLSGNRNAQTILGSWNKAEYDWGYTDMHASQDGETQTLIFTRPLQCAANAPSSCYNIPTDGTEANFIFAFHNTITGDLPTLYIEQHTSVATGSVLFPYDAAPTPTPNQFPYAPYRGPVPEAAASTPTVALTFIFLSLACVFALVF